MLFRQGKVKCALVVAPLSVLRVWDQHLRAWAPELEVTVVHGSQCRRATDWLCPAHVYLTTYDVLRADVLPAMRGAAITMSPDRRNQAGSRPPFYSAGRRGDRRPVGDGDGRADLAGGMGADADMAATECSHGISP